MPLVLPNSLEKLNLLSYIDIDVMVIQNKSMELTIEKDYYKENWYKRINRTPKNASLIRLKSLNSNISITPLVDIYINVYKTAKTRTKEYNIHFDVLKFLYFPITLMKHRFDYASSFLISFLP